MHRILTSDDDLDNITENGIYYYYTDDVPANAPFENAAIVEVFGSNSDTTQKVQRVTRYGVSGETAERSLLSSNWLDWVHFVTNADLTNGTDTRVAVKHDGGTNTRMVLDCTSPSEGYVSLEGIDGAWYRRLKFLSNGQIIYAYKATNGTEKTKVISEAPT